MATAPLWVMLSPMCRPFEAEIAWVLAVVVRWTGIDLRLWQCDGAPRDNWIYYGQDVDVAAPISVRESFFTGYCRAGEHGLEMRDDRPVPVAAACTLLDVTVHPLFPAPDTPPLAPAAGGQGWRVGFDLFGALFFLLSRIEELDRSALDRHGRFQSIDTLAGRCGFLARPEADWMVELLCVLVRQAFGIAAAVPSRPTLIPTHDVDRLRAYHSLPRLFRDSAADIARRRVSPWRGGANLARALVGEPARSFTYLMDRAEEHGLTARFFFIAGSRHPLDGDYAQRFSGDLRTWLRRVGERGHRIGFHPGYRTFDDPVEWRRQKAALEDAAGLSVTEGRQHVLRFHPYTWDIWHDAGMTSDFTMAFPEPGYRAGTTRTYPAYSLRRRRGLAVDVAPTAIMDFQFFMTKYNHFTEAKAFDIIRATLADHVRFGGQITLLFHSVTVMSMTAAYERLLDMATDALS